ncbi:MAG TPA: MobF family relaxase [Actinomycetes bacterium]|nr:MobF family relaxase [Actinomycetes bacterium]
MAVVATIAKGYDLDYVWKNVGSARAADYYIQAFEAGEPPGRWWGPGAEALGLSRGQRVDREPYDLLFGERRAPDGARLGRPPRFAEARERYREVRDELLAAEPHATAERVAELRIEAAKRARLSPLYMDLTVSFSKSISVFHASLGENARLARLAGDAAGEAYWAGLLDEMDRMIYAAVWAGFDYFQREAGYTRTGSHARRVDGRETGQWHEAELAVAHWLQHTSRDGDMQLHVHSQVAHICRTAMDGKWRAPDSLGYQEHVAAVGSVVAQHLEETLTRRFGVQWTAREDGRGFEIAGIPEELLRVFSSRRADIDATTQRLAAEFEQRYGRKPSQRETGELQERANLLTRKGKDDGAIDWDALREGWAAKLAATLGISLASVARSAWGLGADGATATRSADGLSVADMERTVQKALAVAHRERSTFTRADLIKHLGRVLPRTGIEPARAARLLEELANRALRSEFEDVACLEALEAVPVPRDLIRADGRSIFQRHGGTRYATRVQLTMEERLVAQAGANGAPHLSREESARLLGASMAQLDAALRGHASTAHAELTQTGLRMDQAAAAHEALSSSRSVVVINAPAGSGKTRTLIEAGRAWAHAGKGRVIGLTPSQASRNTLATGVPDSYNTARFLGHLPGRRGARGRVEIGPGDLVLADEASMISNPDLADVVAYVARRNAKLVLAGDAQQLQAVENGGGMSLLARRLGYAQLAEPVRFSAAWEREASLRFRAGDTSVLAEYDAHGRILAGEPEDMMEEAARRYVALTLDGKDVLLMAQDHAHRRELCRRIRGELKYLGLVSRGPSVQIADGQEASVGDLIVCTKNNHSTAAGEPDRTLANGDLLRIEEIVEDRLVVRRALDVDPQTGGRRWTDHAFLYGAYELAELGYAVTDHAAQSRTVHTGMQLITGSETRQQAYVGISRGTETNLALVYTVTPKLADPRPGARPAPELGRFQRLTRERVGEVLPEQRQVGREAVGVLADVLERDGAELSALETQELSFSASDNLAILHAQWQSETSAPQAERYHEMTMRTLPAGYRGDLGHQAKWLWRTLRTAQLAGLDPQEVLTTAIGERDLVGVHDVASVVDARIRRRVAGMVPLPQPPWSELVPGVRAEHQAYVQELALAMDARKDRIGEHAVEHEPEWAIRALGPVPDEPLNRLAWQRKAASIGAYRELSGFDHPIEAIGPEPVSDDPDRRAAWYEAFACLGPADGPDVRSLTDGTLHLMRDSYRTETAWAPRYVTSALRQARTGADDAELQAIRRDALAQANRKRGHKDAAAANEVLAASYLAMADAYRSREMIFEMTERDRREWEAITEQPRRLAISADSELRRRHPGQHLEPLRSAEPEPVTEAEQSELALAPDTKLGEIGEWIKDLAAHRTAFAEKLAERNSMTIPAEDPDYEDLGLAFPALGTPERDAILQPPKPVIKPSARVLVQAWERDHAPEAAS